MYTAFLWSHAMTNMPTGGRGSHSIVNAIPQIILFLSCISTATIAVFHFGWLPQPHDMRWLNAGSLPLLLILEIYLIWFFRKTRSRSLLWLMVVVQTFDLCIRTTVGYESLAWAVFDACAWLELAIAAISQIVSN